MEQWRQHWQRGHLGLPSTWSDKETFFRKGEAVDRVFVLKTGAVEVFHATDDGRGILVKLLRGPCFFATIEAVAKEPVYLESVRASGRADAFVLPKKAFDEMLAREPALAIDVLRDTAVAFCAAAKLEQAHLATTEQRLASVLLGYGSALGRRGDDGAIALGVKRSQQDLAEAIGATERSVNRILQRWKEARVVDKQNGHYRIVDEGGLRDIAGVLADALLHGGD